MDRLLTVRELAERLRVTPTCVYRWLAENRLPVVRFSSRCLRFRESDIEKMLEQLGQSAVREEWRTTQSQQRRPRDRDDDWGKDS
jgi:excisionase family DNA binding protein